MYWITDPFAHYKYYVEIPSSTRHTHTEDWRVPVDVSLEFDALEPSLAGSLVAVGEGGGQQCPFSFPEMFLQGGTADPQLLGEPFVRDCSWPVVVTARERFGDDIALALGQRRIHIGSEFFEVPERDRPERAQIVDDVLEILATKREDVVFSLPT